MCKYYQALISQSGSLYQTWSWYTSEKQAADLIADLKQKNSCQETSIYDCVNENSTTETLAALTPNDPNHSWKPTADDDFFNSLAENYTTSQRYLSPPCTILFIRMLTSYEKIHTKSLQKVLAICKVPEFEKWNWFNNILQPVYTFSLMKL